MKVLVTGASGFIGRHLVRRLAAESGHVNALVRNENDVEDIEGVTWHLGDITDDRSLASALSEINLVYHLAAAVPGKGGCRRQWRVNQEGTRILLQACLEHKIRRMVFLSSVCVYAPPLKRYIEETDPVGGGDSYGQSKAAAELEIIKGAPAGFGYVILRPCQVYGPGDDDGFTGLLKAVLDRRYVLTAGRRAFSLIFIDDLIEAVIRAGAASVSGTCIANVSNPSPVSLDKIISTAAALNFRTPRPVALPCFLIRFLQELRWLARNLNPDGMRPIRKSYAADRVYGSLLLGGPEYSHREAQRQLGFEPRCSLADGLRRILG